MNRYIKSHGKTITIVSIFLILCFFGSSTAEKGRQSIAQERLDIAEYKDFNIILISLGNVGAKHMSLYGYERKTTPGLDKMARDAIVLENCFSEASWTLPVATSVFTSLHPYAHKVMDRYHGNLLNENIVTFPEIMQAHGYKTAAFTGGLDHDSRFGHMKGFEKTESNPDFSGYEVTLAQADKWLSENSDSKFLLFIHGYTTHCPFTPPERFQGVFNATDDKKITVDPEDCLRGYRTSKNEYIAYIKMKKGPTAEKDKLDDPEVEKRTIKLNQDDIDFLEAGYDEEVLFEDHMITEFLDSLNKKVMDKTIVIIFSEHGEMFAKHGRFGRAGTTRGTLYDDVMHLPLVIDIPGVSGKRVDGLVQVTDIMPTILDILGIVHPAGIQGKSMLPLINEGSQINRYVYSGLEYNYQRPMPNPFYNKRSRMEYIRDGDWKLIREVIYLKPERRSQFREEEILELYEIGKDPDELTDVAFKHPDVVLELQEKLRDWVKWSKAFSSADVSTLKIPEEVAEEARKHGYWE